MHVDCCGTYLYVKDENVLKVKVNCYITLERAVEIYEVIMGQLKKFPNCGLLIDCKDVSFSGCIRDVNCFIKYLTKRYTEIKNYCVVFVSKNPEQVVYTTLMKHYLGQLGLNVEVCSTMNFAKDYLQSFNTQKSVPILPLMSN